jgi:hypothetical protein
MDEDASSNHWRVTINNNKKQLKNESRIVDGCPWIRASIPLDYDALTCCRYTGTIGERLKYETNLQQLKTLEVMGVNMTKIYSRTFRVLMVAPRDAYCYCFVDYRASDGSISTTLF